MCTPDLPSPCHLACPLPSSPALLGGAFRPHPSPPSCPTALPDTCCRVRTLPERAEFVRSLQGTIKFALLSGCCVCGSSRKAKSTRSGPLTAPRGPLGCSGHDGSDVVVVDEELSIRVHGISGLDVNAAPNRHEVAVAICPVERIDKSSDEMPSSVPGIGIIASRLAVKAVRLTGNSLDMMVPLCPQPCSDYRVIQYGC